MSTRSALTALTLPWLMFLATPPSQAQQQKEETFHEIVPGDPSSDPANLMARALRGDVRAMNNIGLLWAHGVGVEKPNYEEAMRWWKEAAKHGYPLAMNNLGLLFANGQGVAKDPRKALAWWQRSADLGNGWAMNNIGDLYERGEGVEQNDALALEWYGKGAEADEALAMYNVGSLHERGRGVPQDFSEALRWYARAADRGIAYAMHGLGQLTEAGKGTPADLAEAQAWYTVAADYYISADTEEIALNVRAREALAARLSPDETERARLLAASLKERIELKRKPRELKPGERDT